MIKLQYLPFLLSIPAIALKSYQNSTDLRVIVICAECDTNARWD